MREFFTVKIPEGVTFTLEPFTVDLFQETVPLLAAHWSEVAHFQDIPLSPDFRFYATCAEAGVLRVFTARKDGGLIGYSVYFVRRNPHYVTSIQANQDILYLQPSARGGLGMKFIKWCDEQLRAEGVQAVYQHVKAEHNFGLMLQRIGYELVDLIYARRLDQEK